MSERNERMAAMLAAGVPGRDLAFEIAVLARIERRRFHREIARNLVVAAGACLLLALVMPALHLDLSGVTAPLSRLAGNTPAMTALLAAAFAAWHYYPRTQA